MYRIGANFNYFFDNIIFIVPTPDVLNFSIGYVGKFLVIIKLFNEDQCTWLQLEAPWYGMIMEYIMEYNTGNEPYM